MKRSLSAVVVVGVLALGAAMLFAEDGTPVNTGVMEQGGPAYFWNSVNIASNKLYIGGVLTVPSNTLYSSTYNIPVANMTNGAGTVGPSIGGNIPLSAITNALAGKSGVVTNKSTQSTNVFWYLNGVVTNWTLNP